MGFCLLLFVGFFPSCYFLNYLIENLNDMEERELQDDLIWKTCKEITVIQDVSEALCLRENKLDI